MKYDFNAYRINFIEEGVYLNLTGRLSTEIQNAMKEAGDFGSIVDNGYLHARPITERLLRRIVAKLLRVSYLFRLLACCLESS